MTTYSLQRPIPPPVPQRSGWPVWLVPLALVAAGLVIMALSAVRSGGVIVSPIPGGQVAPPQSQIAFRGVSPSKLGAIAVTGSLSGKHLGAVLGHSDGRGASFVPRRPFAPGEVVTVHTGLHIQGVPRGTFHFTVATPAGAIPVAAPTPASRASGDVLAFHSRPDLAPPAVQVTKDSGQAVKGDVFLTPQGGPEQNGLMILDRRGSLVWFQPLSTDQMASDFRVQTLNGQRVLTWWQGQEGAGVGFGEDVIESQSYKRMATVRAGNGLTADLHEFQLSRRGTAFITAYYPVYWNASAAHGSPHQIVLDGVVQEIDIKTGLVLYQWDSLDHVPLAESQVAMPAADQPFDYFHINSVQQTSDGNLIVSARNTWAGYDIDYRTGRTIWTLGGKRTSFKMGPGTTFAFQHDVRLRSSDDGTVTVFDDGGGPPVVHAQSRAITLHLDTDNGTATLVGQDAHKPGLSAGYEGNVQLLDGGNQFVGWGQQPYFTEFSPSGKLVYDGHFVGGNSTYRAFRFGWQGTPATQPAVAASTSGQNTLVYASWNGATDVSSWRVLAGASPQSLRPVQTVARQGFETQASVAGAAYVAVQALGRSGRVLGTSSAVRPG